MKIFNQAKSMNISKLILAVAIVVAVSFAAKAQPGSTGGFDDEPQDVPVDGGISLLAIAGAAYGYKKLKNSYHNKK
jgi:hypothetical protein